MEQTLASVKEDHLPFLDGFRGFAALWVVAFHSMRIVGTKIPLISEGLAAVQVFMIMSGFLMAYHYYARRTKEPWESSKTVRNFYVRRFFRIAPLYYLLFVVYLWAGPTLGEFRKEIAHTYPSLNALESRYSDRSLSNVLWHVSFLFGLSPHYSFHSPMPDWSIGLEMQFYLVFPVLMLLFRGNYFYLSAVGIFLVCKIVNKFLVKGVFVMPSFLTLSMVFFLIGMLLAVSHHHRQDKRNKWTAIVTAAVLAVLSKQVLIVAVTGLLVYLLHSSQKGSLYRIIAGPLSGRAAGLLADLSYCVYLLHMLFLLPIAYLLTRWDVFLGLPGVARFLVVFALTVAMVYPASVPLFRWVETRGIAWGKKLVIR